MEEHTYREQLIRVIATQTPGTPYWVARADVRVQKERAPLYYPLQGPRDRFTAREEAELNILQEAKKLIDKVVVE